MNEDQRRARRIEKENLPACLHNLVMTFDTGEEMKVETVDASTMGLGLTAPMRAEELDENPGVLLHPEDNSFQLLGEVVFVRPQGEESCRVGVQFSQTIAVQKYLSLIEEAGGTDPDESGMDR